MVARLGLDAPASVGIMLDARSYVRGERDERARVRQVVACGSAANTLAVRIWYMSR